MRAESLKKLLLLCRPAAVSQYIAQPKEFLGLVLPARLRCKRQTDILGTQQHTAACCQLLGMGCPLYACSSVSFIAVYLRSSALWTTS